MTEKAIQNIYNNLLNWEGQHTTKPYPIHKKLNKNQFGCSDIYEWIANTYLLNSKTKILDAGCGVGYGSIFLSKKFNCEVTGISLSPLEIKKCNEFAKIENVENQVKFVQQSYDNLEPESFDFIIAIESVKHSLNINNTLNSLKNALNNNGVLLIIDDFLINEFNNQLVKSYSRDWALKLVLKQDDFIPEFELKRDLTPFVMCKHNFTLMVSIFILGLANSFFEVAKIIRGGFYLEKLFNQKSMKYYVLEYKNN